MRFKVIHRMNWRLFLMVLVLIPALLLTAALFGGGAGWVVADQKLPPDAPSIYAQAINSTVLLRVAEDDTSGSQGSGFYVSPHILLTCAHVTHGRRRCRIYQDVARADSTVPGWVLLSDSLRDVAVVYSEKPSTTLHLRMTSPTIGEPVLQIGNPYGYMGSLSTGVVSQVRNHPDEKRGLVQCSSLGEPGASGGPLLDHEGKVLGMTSFRSESGCYTFGVDAATMRSVLSNAAFAYKIHREDSVAAALMHDADSVFAGIELTEADLTALLRGGGGEAPDEIGAGAPFGDSGLVDRIWQLRGILLLLLALGAVFLNRYLRLRRQGRLRRLRRELEDLKSCAFLPDRLIEAECGKAP